MDIYELGQGGRVGLDRASVSRGGEGYIADVHGRPDWVAKVFHTEFRGITSIDARRRKNDGLNRKRQKVHAMVRETPRTRRNDGHIVLAWPEDVLLRNGTVAGFVMPKIDVKDALEVHQITNRADRFAPMPGCPQWARDFDFRYLTRTAYNLASAVQMIHNAGVVIGDFNERNILVMRTALVSLVDCDSMQFTRGRHTYLCEVGRPEYTAPELQGVDFHKVVRGQESDLFALGVHIYMLLLDGAQPFRGGAWRGDGDPLEF